MLTLPALVTAHLANSYTAPITQVEITFPDSYVKRFADRECTYGGNTYASELVGAVTIEQTLSGKFDNAELPVVNIDNGWGALLNTYTVPEIQQATVAIYQAFTGVADRVQIYSGKLDVPKDTSRKQFTLRSTQILNSITEQFNRVVFSPTCQWSLLGLFGLGTRCNYDPDGGVGRCGQLTGDIDASTTTIPVDHVEYYLADEYIQIGNEILLITAVGAGTGAGNLTATRARKSTTAAAHDSADKVYHDSCCGSYDACKAKNLPWRWAGYAFVPMRGTYTYGQHVFLWKWNNVTRPWEAQYEKGLYGAPWGVVYGEIKASPLVISFKDTGFVGCYLCCLGHGQIENIIAAPTSYPIGDPTPGGGGPYIVVNGSRWNDYGFYRGLDGADGVPTSGGWDNQYISGYWDPAFPSGVEAPTYANGQTLSRMAYIAGAFASRPEAEEGFPEILVWCQGRKLQTYNADGSVNGVPYYTNNPAWVLADMLVNEEYGAGVPVTDINWQQFIDAASDFTTAGFEFNAHLTAQMSIVDVLKLVTNATRSFITYADGKLGLKVMKPTLSNCGVTITSADVIDGSWKYWTQGGGIDRDANVLEFGVQAEEYDYQNVPVQFVDEEHVAAIGRRKSMKLDVTGITLLEQAKAVGTWHMNLTKMTRRQDGARKLTVINKYMALQPGDIITVDLTDLDGQASADYMVWTTKRVNNAGDIELELIKWETGLFELGGISYDTPTTQINPMATPVDIANLAGTITDVGGENSCEVTWDWPSSSGESPEPVKVFFYAGNADETADTYTLLLVEGVRKPIESYTWTEAPRPYDTIRVVAVAQSAFDIPVDPKPTYVGDSTYQTTLTSAVLTTDTAVNVTSAAALDLAAGDFVCLAAAGIREFCKVSSVVSNTVNLVTSGGLRTTYFGTSRCAHASGAAVSKGKILQPYTDLTVAVVADTDVPGAPPDVTATVAGNQITVTWGTPATHNLGIEKYYIKYGQVSYTEGGGLYTITPCETIICGPELRSWTFTVATAGQYAIGVSAVNAYGESALGILWEEDE